MVDMKEIASAFDKTEDEVKQIYNEVLKEVKEKHGEEDAESKTIRKVVAKLQKTKFAGVVKMNVAILAAGEPKDFNELIIRAIKKKIENIPREEAIKQKYMNEAGDFLYQKGFNAGNVIKGDNYDQDIIALDLDKGTLVHLSARKRKYTEAINFNNICQIETIKKQNVANGYILNALIPSDKAIDKKEVDEKISKLECLPDNDLYGFLTSGETREVLIESTLIKSQTNQKTLLTLQIPGQLNKKLLVWIDDPMIGDELVEEETVKVLINGAKYNDENDSYTSNSIFVYQSPQVSPEKDGGN